MSLLFGPDGEGGPGRERGAPGDVGPQHVPGQSVAGHEHRPVSETFHDSMVKNHALVFCESPSSLAGIPYLM